MITLTKPVSRKVNIPGWKRPMILTVHPNGLLEMRELAGRRTYTANLLSVFYQSVKAQGGGKRGAA
jgi:hypothetical protein